LCAGARLKEPKNTGFQKHVTPKKAGKEAAPKKAAPKKGKRKDPQPPPTDEGSAPSEDEVDDSDNSSESAPAEHKGGTGKMDKRAILKMQQELVQIRQQLAEQSGGYLEGIEDEKNLDMISGVTLNVKRGEAGSLVHKHICEVEPYTAMPSWGWQKRLVESILD